VPWTRPAGEIHNAVRGLQPWPLVAAKLAGTRVLIHRTIVFDERSDALAGTVVRADADGIAVTAGDARVVRILELQPEGRRAMQARDFLAGRHVEAGATIEPA